MIHAVIASEDNKFVSHHGFDAEAIRKARKLNREGKKIYGASTISQQVSKNVFLWHGRSWVRKGLEAYYTAWLELLVPKKRIMEIYLNVAEFGDGVYGVEAASEFFFQQSSSKLRPKEAAVLAACLPNPLKNNPIKPTERLKKRQAKIMRLMSKINKTEWGVSF